MAATPDTSDNCFAHWRPRAGGDGTRLVLTLAALIGLTVRLAQVRPHLSTNCQLEVDNAAVVGNWPYHTTSSAYVTRVTVTHIIIGSLLQNIAGLGAITGRMSGNK